MGKLTDTQLRAIKGSGKAQKLSDGEGLFLFVTPTGGTSWRIKYRFGGKEKLLCLGKYPQISLAKARKQLAETKESLAQGFDGINFAQ